MQLELISVIIPVYKVEKYLRQCVDSVINQTYPNIEIILVDDGSPDNCGQICDEYAENYSNIKAVHKENAGLGMARNTGLEYINGEYVAFLDSDDYWEPEALEVLYTKMQKYHVDICKGGFRRVTNQGEILETRDYSEVEYPNNGARTMFLPRLVGSAPSQHDSVEMCVCGVLYSAQIIKDYDIRFPSERELISEDMVFNIEYLQHANGACVISDVSYNYRDNPTSLTKSYRKDRFPATIFFYQFVRNRLLELGYDNDVILRLQKILFIYLSASIKQERKESSGKKLIDSIRSIKQICSDEIVQEVISLYPIIKLGYKQQIFIRLVKYRMGVVLYVFASLGLM